MAAGLGLKTFVTGDVLTAADTNGYLMQGVWVFADAAARTAAVTSPQEGNMSYLKDTNSTEYYSGSAWVAVGSSASNGMTLINTTSFTTSSSVSIDNLFSATYNNYRLILTTTATSGGCDVKLKLRSGGADNSSNDYQTQASYLQAGALNNLAGTTTTGFSVMSNGDGACTIIVDLNNPFVASATKSGVINAMGGANDRYTFGGFRKANSTQFTGVSFIPSPNNITGSVSIYGLAK
jgi:hypothetical protein